MITYRIVIERQSDNKPLAALDVAIRFQDHDVTDEEREKIKQEIRSFLNIGPFYGSWVDPGTERDTYSIAG